MKGKLTILSLAAALSLPVGAQVAKTPTASVFQQKKRAEVAATVKALRPAVKRTPAKAAAGNVDVTFVVENVWGDGSGYQLLIGNESTMTTAEYWNDVYGNALYTIPSGADFDESGNVQNMIIEGEMSIEVPAGRYDYCVTNPTPGDRVWMATNGQGTIEFKAGYAYTFHVFLAGTSDNVEIIAENVDGAGTPTDLTVYAAATTAEVQWTAGERNDGWNLRYREVAPGAENNRTWTFQSDDDYEGWVAIDADGDGNTWGSYTSNDGNTMLTSASWSTVALTPDNWLISPEINMGCTLKLNIWGQDPSYPLEHFAVYLCLGEYESVDDFEPISAELITTGNADDIYEFDLTGYEGTGFFAVRHYNSTDMFRINVDNVMVIYGEELPWTDVENATSPYTLAGLTPATNYEVQVQGVNELGASDWSESTYFTTFDQDPDVAVTDINSDKADSNVWYNMAGMKLNGTPVDKGIYIHNGEKVVVR